MSDADLIGRARQFDGKVFDVDRDEVRLPHGRTVTMDVVRHPR